MPFADPEKSFDAAVHHLFRHVGDARALRRNPLVRAHFSKASKRRTDDVVLAEIRARILQLAAVCRSEDAASGSESQARRRHEIVSAICSGEPASQTAERLNLSRRQYYRERQSVCTRVARALLPQQNDRPVLVETGRPLDLLFRRAASLSDQGLAQKAVVLLDNAWSGIAPGEDRFAARLELADASISFGDVTRAGKLLEYARSEIAKSGDKMAIVLRDRATLIEARFAFANGRDAQAGPTLDALADRQIAGNRIDETALETLVECGLWHCSNARFSKARRMLRRARVLVAKLARLAPNQQVALALLHAYCAEDIADEFNGSYRRFREALELSTANASMRGSLEATIGLMGYYGSVGRDDAVFQLAERALEIARATEGHRHLLFATAWIGTTVMKTRYWRAVEPLLSEAERLARPGTLHWVFMKEAQADLLARLAHYEMAQASFAAVQDAARSLENRKWEAIVLRDMGLMLGSLGRSESTGVMRQAIALAEANAGRWSLSLTYSAASKVLPDKGITHRAREVSSTLARSTSQHAVRHEPLTLAGSQSGYRRSLSENRTSA